MADEIIFERTGEWGVVTLNRPDALNALTPDMIAAFFARLAEWERHPSVRAVLVKGAGERAFCAGADIRKLHDEGKKDPRQTSEFFRHEYRLNAAIHHLAKPCVAIIDGVTMGGGVGLSVHGDFRVAGDKTLFAMPETAIGLFPDVGGGYFLPRLHDGLGLYYGLTGARAKAADCMAAGIATHYAPSARMDDLVGALLESPLASHAHADIEKMLDEFSGDPGEAHVNQIRPALKRIFTGHRTFDDFWRALNDNSHDVAGDMRRILARMSPTSIRITFEQLRRGDGLDFDAVMKMEFRIARRIMDGHDFYEGVRAQIIDKDKAPMWSPASVEGVDDAEVEKYFAPLGPDEELSLP